MGLSRLLRYPAPMTNPDKTCIRTLAFATSFAKATAAKARTCPHYKSCNVTDFWFRLYLYRDTAQVLLTNILYRDSIPASIKLVPPTCGARRDTRNAQKTSTLDGKKCAPDFASFVGASIPSLHYSIWSIKIMEFR